MYSKNNIDDNDNNNTNNVRIININNVNNDKYNMDIRILLPFKKNLNISDTFNSSLEAAIHYDIETLNCYKIFLEKTQDLKIRKIFIPSNYMSNNINYNLNFPEISPFLFETISNLFNLKNITNIRQEIYKEKENIKIFEKKNKRIKWL